jgi:drug/metabolite transporter (DMT)-like permease
MLGFIVVIAASIVFCFQNLIVRILFNAYPILGLGPIGGFLPPTLQNSFLLLVMRMGLGVPLMAILATHLYDGTWQELRNLTRSQHRSLLWRSLGGGALMFSYLALLYVSIGLIPTGIALTLFFTYPLFTALLAWGFFGNRPTRLNWIVMVLILLGSMLTVPFGGITATNWNWFGALLGIGAGFTYALYTVNGQKVMTQLHPVPFTWLSFATTLVLSTGCLVFWQQPPYPLDWSALWIGGLGSAVATATGHLLFNFGIHQIGAPLAAMIGSINPALTVVLAWGLIQETLTIVQVMGVLLVTLSVVALNPKGSPKGEAKGQEVEDVP